MATGVTYKAFIGRHGMRTLASGITGGVLRGLTSKSIHVTFHGSCYYCGYASHSQMYCPLRWCKVCKQYGHSEAVCARLRPPSHDDDEDAEWD